MTASAGIVVGCEQLGGTDWGQVDRGEVERAIVEAFELGLTAFDTADVYGLGESERRLSAALGHRRHDAFIVTKGGVRWKEAEGRATTFRDNDPRYLAEAIDNSLRRLRVDKIGMYFVHWPDSVTPIEAVLDCLSEAKRMGKIGAYGLSNFPATVAIQSHGRGVDAVQISFNLLSGADERRELVACGEAGLARYGYGALAQGLLTGRYKAGAQFGADDRRHRLRHFQPEFWSRASLVLQSLEEVSLAVGARPADVAIQVLRQSNLVDHVIVGIKTSAQARALAALLGGRLPEEVVRRLLAVHAAAEEGGQAIDLPAAGQ